MTMGPTRFVLDIYPFDNITHIQHKISKYVATWTF